MSICVGQPRGSGLSVGVPRVVPGEQTVAQLGRRLPLFGQGGDDDLAEADAAEQLRSRHGRAATRCSRITRRVRKPARDASSWLDRPEKPSSASTSKAGAMTGVCVFDARLEAHFGVPLGSGPMTRTLALPASQTLIGLHRLIHRHGSDLHGARSRSEPGSQFSRSSRVGTKDLDRIGHPSDVSDGQAHGFVRRVTVNIEKKDILP